MLNRCKIRWQLDNSSRNNDEFWVIYVSSLLDACREEVKFDNLNEDVIVEVNVNLLDHIGDNQSTGM